MKNCKTCKYFKRGKWYKSIDPKEGDRLGGNCVVLLRVLSMENSEMTWMDGLNVQDTFGCSLHKTKKT